MTINYYKKTEYLLYNYKMLEISIENMEQEIEYLKNHDGSTGLSYDGISTSPTHKISSSTEDIALSNTEKIHFLEHCISKEKWKIQKIDRVINGLSDIERMVVTLRYIEGKNWNHIVGEVNYSERHCRRIRTTAIKKMIVAMFGGDEVGNKNKPK